MTNIEQLKTLAWQEYYETYKGILEDAVIEQGWEWVEGFIDRATELERNSWINQPANEHDERIRLAERMRCAKIVRGWKLNDGWEATQEAIATAIEANSSNNSSSSNQDL